MAKGYRLEFIIIISACVSYNYIQVTVNTPSRCDGMFTKQLDTKLEKLGRALAGGNISTIAKAVFANTDLRDKMVDRVLTEIERECSTLCKRKLPTTGSPSLFRKIPVVAMPGFSWKDCVRVRIQCSNPPQAHM